MTEPEPHRPAGTIGLTKFERAYGWLAPIAFGGAQGWERLRGATKPELEARRGYVPAMNGPTLWFHGASAGEMAAAIAFDQMLHRRGFEFASVYTASNRAGIAYTQRNAPNRPVTTLAPWDLRANLTRAIDRWSPRLIFLLETELWPRLVYEAHVRKIPIFCLSARIYPRDIKRYKAIRWFFEPTLRRIDRIVAQDETERDHFRQIGAPQNSCFAGGNLKYLNLMPGTRVGGLRAELGIAGEPPIVVVGSLHLDEAAEVLAALRQVKIPGLRIIIAPRHLDTVESLLGSCRVHGWTVRRRSDAGGGAWEVLVMDTIGELRRFYGIASCAIVAGGFRKHGGHNPYEPVLADAPVIFGPNFDHFQSEARTLADATPEARVSSAVELTGVVARWLADERQRHLTLARQKEVLPDATAIAERYVTALSPWLSLIAA